MLRNHPLSVAAILATVFAAGCVSSGKYDDLKKLYDDSQADLAATNESLEAEKKKSAELDAELTDKRNKLEALQEENAAVQKEIVRLTEAENALTEQLAQLLKDRSRLKQSTKQLQEALAELARRKAEADKRVARFRSLLAKFKAMIDAGKLQVMIVDGRMVLALPSDVLFGSGSADLSKDGKAAVTEVASVLATLKERRFQVEGHTDDDPIRTAKYASNWELSSSRALGVVGAMMDAGMDGRYLSAAGFGPFRPVASNGSKEGKAKNRRIEIVLVPDLSNLPGFDELKAVVENK